MVKCLGSNWEKQKFLFSDKRPEAFSEALRRSRPRVFKKSQVSMARS